MGYRDMMVVPPLDDLVPEFSAGEDEFDRRILDARNVGERKDIPPGQTLGILNVIGSIKEGQVMALTLVKTPPPNTLGNLYSFPIAVIEFGQGGLTATVEVDFKNGCVLSLPASAIRVSARNEEAVQGEPDPVLVGCGAFVNYLPAGRRAKLTRTFRLTAIDPAATSAKIVIPPFAMALQVERTPATNPFTIHVYDQANQAIAEMMIAANQSQPTPFELPGDAALVDITNTGGAAMDAARLMFEIGL